MSRSIKNRIWAMPKSRVISHIIVIAIVNLASIVVLLLFWNNIESHHKAILLPLPFISFIYLLMFVKYIELGESQFCIKTVFESKFYEYKNITSIEIKGRGENSYLKVKINKPFYLRKELTFYDGENQNEMIEYLKSKTNNHE